MAALQPTILRFPDEILDHILEYLAHDSGRLLTIDQRASLSVESFASGPIQSPQDSNETSRFRWICRRFAELGINRQFARVPIRFSPEGFEKIRFVVEQPHLAREVKKLSYMVHDFYPQSKARFEQLLNEARSTTANLQREYDRKLSTLGANGNQTPINQLHNKLHRSKQSVNIITQAMTRAENQRRIIEGRVDEQVLLNALSAFEKLQQIRLMRLVDHIDMAWQNFLRTRPALQAEFRPSEWTVACEHATSTLGRAYLASRSRAHRLSSRFMDPQSPLLLAHSSQATIASLATRLTCLELQFDDPVDLNGRMLQLSDVFLTLFTAAVNIKGLHIGFSRPVSIPLETVFCNVKWKELQYIGFGAWHLSSNEIIDFIRRHRESLKSVRLRGVRLNKGRWVEILKVLRLELKLKWVSLRQVGYFPKIGGGPTDGSSYRGFAILQAQPNEDYEDDSVSDEDINWEHLGMDNVTGQPAEEEHETSPSENNEDEQSVSEADHDDESGESHEGSVAGDSEVGVVNDFAIDDQIMVHHSSASDHHNSITSRCDCRNGYAWEDLEDDEGLDPTKPQWKRWEKWAIKRCLIHDPPTLSAS